MSLDKPTYLLDSFAFLAYLDNEPGMALVQEVLTQADSGSCQITMSLINLGEVLYIVERERGLSSAQKVLALVESLPVKLLEVSRDLILDAAHVKANNALSYADAFAVATAMQEQAVIITGDPEFKLVENLVRVEWLLR